LAFATALLAARTLPEIGKPCESKIVLASVAGREFDADSGFFDHSGGFNSGLLGFAFCHAFANEHHESG
jgi:hypothetical protein